MGKKPKWAVNFNIDRQLDRQIYISRREYKPQFISAMKYICIPISPIWNAGK